MKKSYEQIVSIILVFVLMLSVFTFGIFNVLAEESDYGCRESFANFFQEVNENATEKDFWNEYETKSYFSSTSSEATPDFILVYCCNGLSFAAGSVVLGDYVVSVAAQADPYPLGIYIYTPEERTIYNLSEAYIKDIKGVRAMVEDFDVEYAGVRIIGDVDEDGKLSIKDATLIQKKLAGIVEVYDSISLIYREEYNTSFCYSYADFNRDIKVNIKDATAIQKCLAKIEI